MPLPDERLEHSERMSLAAGNAASWEHAYRRIHTPLYGYCLRLTGSEAAALDLSHEAFTRTMRRCRERGTPEGLRAFLFTTARNLYLNEQARTNRGHHNDIGDLTEVLPAASDIDGTDPEVSALVGEQRGDVQEALAQLPDRQRQALAMCDMEQCSYAETGVALGLSENAVAQLVFRARARLRLALRLRQIDESALPDTCRGNIEAISRKLDGQLRGEAASQLAEHLALCAVCREVEESFALVQRRYRAFAPLLPLSLDDSWAHIADEATHEGLLQQSDGFGYEADDPVFSRSGAHARSGMRRALIKGLVVGGVLAAIGAGAYFLIWNKPASTASTKESRAANNDSVNNSNPLETEAQDASSGRDTGTADPAAADTGVTADPAGEATPDTDTGEGGEPGTDTGATDPATAGPANLQITAVSWGADAASIAIRNSGESAAGDSTVQITIGSTNWSSAVGSLAPGAGTTVNIDTGCREGNFTITAKADSGNMISESSESDNSLENSFNNVC